MKGVLTPNNIIDEALVEIRDFERANFKEASVYFLKGWRDFQIFEAGAQVKEAWRDITAINTVPFPEDLLRLIDVSIVLDGEYFSFTKSDILVDPITDPLDKTRDTTRGEDDTLRRSPSVGYGAQGNNLEYYYKEDRAKRRIILSRMALDQTLFADRTEVLVRYVATGMDDFNSTYIAADAGNMLVAYVAYKLVQARPEKYNPTYMAVKKEEYIEHLRMYRALEMPSLQELEDMIYESSGQNVRR